MAWWQSIQQVAVSGGGGGAYSGVGDKFPGAGGAYGLRAYNAAYATGSNSAAIICDTATFATCSTINILANGDFDKATAAASAACATACVVKSLTDQSGSGHTMTCAAAASCATLVFNCNGTKPCLRFAGAAQYSTTFTESAPVSYSIVAKRTSVVDYALVISTSGNPFLGFNNTSGFAAAGSDTGILTLTAAENVFHSVQSTQAGSGTNVFVDNTTTSNSNTQGAPGATVFLGARSGAFSFTGDFEEAYFWSGSAMAGTDATNVCRNQQTYWGFTGAGAC